MSDEPLPIDPVTGQPAAILFEGVWKSFGSLEVLRNLDLKIPRGRVTCVIGRSGTGKSVTLKHILGLLRPDRGRVLVGGVDLTRLRGPQLRALRDRFGVVFQQAALFDSMTVFENVAFPLVEHSSLSRAQIAQRVHALLDQVGLKGAAPKVPSELSGGMRKRVGLARALAREPRFLLYDEPTAGLDPVLAAAMDRLILQTQRAREGITSVVITHDMNAVFRIADKVAFLMDGRVGVEGTPESFRHSDDPRVQQFVRGSLEGPLEV